MNDKSKVVNLQHGHTFKTDVTELVHHYKLVHGDVLMEVEDEYPLARILVQNKDSKTFKLIKNPGPDYMTFPHEEVMEHVTDFRKKYSDLIQNMPSVVFHISNGDAYLHDKFKGCGPIPEEFRFNLEFQWGDLDSMYVSNKPGSDDGGKNFDVEKVTLQEIRDYFAESEKPKEKFEVKVDLKGKKFEEYKEKYSTTDKYSWITAKPGLPAGWDCERGVSHSGSDFHEWMWKVEGPKESHDAAVKEVEKFLEGFKHEIIDSE